MPPAYDASYAGELPARGRLLRGLLVALLAIVMAAAALTIFGAITSDTGTTGFLIGITLAALPLPVVIGAFRWLDRYEPEPVGLLVFAFAWGASVAALVAAVLNTASVALIAGPNQPSDGVLRTAIYVAPWVEEAAKGGAVLMVVLFRRREFDGIVDGIVIAGLSGVGFAFTENIFYFGRAFITGADELGTSGGLHAVGITFILRGVLAPFAHPLFTIATGVGFGVAARSRSIGVKVFLPLTGYFVAVLMHSMWNASATHGVQGFLLGYLLVGVPVFCLAAALAVWSRKREGRLIAEHLPVYVTQGWLEPAEATMLASLPQRRAALEWASSAGPEGAHAMTAFQQAATELAFLRDRATHRTAGSDYAVRERRLLGKLTAARLTLEGLELPA
jgi:RsiW-degrading membrane proteinase PrsW (M82 family)